jgi:hypothetical protein
VRTNAVLDLVVGDGSGGRIAADSLHLQEAPVGGGADLSQSGQVVLPSTDVEVASVVDRGLGA